jgi:hypothetical protein
MPPDTWTLPPKDPRCRFAEELYRTAQAIFLRLSNATTAAQFQAARDALVSYRAHLEENLHWTHYGLSVGTHLCVKEVYREACARLCSLASVQPEPTPQRRSVPPRSADEVVNDIWSLADAVIRSGDTFLGEERADDTAPGESQ